MTADLFADHTPPPGEVAMLGPSARVLRGFALPRMDALWAALQDVTLQAPFRHMVTPGGQRMSVALTNCGALGWVSDRRGYRYTPLDPDNGAPWPALPVEFWSLAHDAAAASAFTDIGDGKFLADIYALAKQRLHAAGVSAVYGGEYCTVLQREDFFSYRRDGQTGRMVSAIWLE